MTRDPLLDLFELWRADIDSVPYTHETQSVGDLLEGANRG